MKRLAKFIIEHPRWIIFAIVGITLLSVYPASQIRTDFNLENFYPKSDQTVQYYRQLEEEFGRDDDIIMIGYRNDSLFTKAGLLQLKEITERLDSIRYIDKVNSIWTAEAIINDNNNLEFEPYLTINELNDVSDSLKNEIINDPFVSGFLLSEDAATTAIYLEIDPDSNTYANRSFIIDQLHTVMDDYPQIDEKISGIPYFRNMYVNILNEEVVFYIAISSALIIIFLWYLYRSMMGIWLPMIIVWLTVLFTVATVTLSGGYLEIMSSTIAPILLCVGVADSIHMISKFDDAIQNGFKKRKAIIEMIITLGSATLLTSVTTAIGFATLVSSSIIPMKRFGIYTAIGVLIAYVITIFLLPSILKVTGTGKIFNKGANIYALLGESLSKVSDFNRKHYKGICLSFLILTLTVSAGMYKLNVNGRVFDDISRDSELIKDSEFFSRELAPPFPMEFIINTNEDNGITDPDFLRRIEDFKTFLLSFEEIKRVTSFSTLLKEVHQAMAPDKATLDPIPENEELVAQYLFLLEINGNESLEQLTDFNYKKLRIAGQVLDAGSMRINQIRDSIQTYTNQNFSKEEVIVTGSTILSADLVGKMVYSLASSIGLAFLGVSIVMAFLFRDAKMVVISLIPNVMPLLLIAGFMGYFGVDIKPSTAVIFTIAFGIAVDDSIHYLARMRVEMKRGKSLFEALNETTIKTGRAIIITSIILLLGFGTLISSEFTSTTLMGILVGSTIFMAVVADLILLPALFYWINPELKSLRSKN